MEIEFFKEEEYEKLCELFSSATQSAHSEIEFLHLLSRQEDPYKAQLKFIYLLEYLRSQSQRWKSLYTPSQISLDISCTINDISHRVSLYNKKEIQEYCESEHRLIELDEKNLICIQKTRAQQPLDLSLLECRCNHKIEIPIVFVNTIRTKFVEHEEKYFRYKQRYSFELENICRMDLTIVKASSKPYSLFKTSDTLRNKEHLEIEMEILNPKVSISNVILPLLLEMKSILNKSPYYLPSEMENAICQQYYDFITLNKEQCPSYKHSRSWLGPQVVSLTRGNISLLQDTSQQYYVTPKTDGLRIMGIFLPDGKLYWIHQNSWKIQYSGMTSRYKKWISIVDGELVTKLLDGSFVFHYYVFDIYYYMGDDVRNRPLLERCKYLDHLASSIDTMSLLPNVLPQFIVKQYSMATPDNIRYLIYDAPFPYATDGLVFTHQKPILYQTFDPNVFQWTGMGMDLFLKWKPQQDTTIDFQVEFIENEQNADGQRMILNIGKRPDYSIFDVLSQLQPGTYGSYPFMPRNRRIILEYIKQNSQIPAEKYKSWIDHYLTKAKECFVRYTNTTKKIVCENQDVIRNHSIVEMYLTLSSDGEMEWHPRNVRFDKKAPNDFRNAIQIWNSYFSPISIDDIIQYRSIPVNPYISEDDAKYYDEDSWPTSSNITALRVFHNDTKRKLIEETIALFADKRKKCKVLELAVGRGGDIGKWNNTQRVEAFVGIDIIRENLENASWGACSRYKQLRNKSFPAIFLLGDCSKPIRNAAMCMVGDEYEISLQERYRDLTLELFNASSSQYPPVPNLPFTIRSTESFDIVSIQFAIHYFFQNEETFLGLLDNIEHMIAMHGFFIGTCLDGNLVLQELQDETFIEGRNDKNVLLWKIERGSELLSDSVFGKNINVYIESIRKISKEYLVDLNFLRQQCSIRNIELIHVRHFEPSAFMDENMARYSRMNCSFIFQKKNLPTLKKKKKSTTTVHR